VRYRLRTKTGEYRWFQARGQAHWNEKGVFLYMAGSIRDANERVTVEKELKRATEELRQLARHLESIREEERKRISREVHDLLGQALTVINIEMYRGVSTRFSIRWIR
jgi:two-component system sensor histidine kinase UhpB